MFFIKRIVKTGRQRVLALALGGCVTAWSGCDSAPEQAPAPPPPKTQAEVAPPLPEPLAEHRPPNLNEALNLLPAEEMFHGFPLPKGVEHVANGRARSIRTTLPRLLRFYYSRYFQVVRLRTGELYDPLKARGQRLKGSDYKIQAADPLKRRAFLHISPRPGSTFLLRVEERRARPKSQPELLRVMEAERQGLDADAPLKPAIKGQSGDAVVPVAEGATLVYKRAKPQKLENFSLKKAKKRALRRERRGGTSRGISNRIYKWSQQGEGRRFLD